MGNITFEQIFRYALCGGITLLVIFGVYAPSEQENINLLNVNGLVGAALLSAVALMVGGLLYTFHRAIPFPLIYRVLLLFKPLRLNRNRSCDDWNIFWPSAEELRRDIARWKERNGKDSVVSHLSEWATQVHYLYCSAWAILVGHLAGWWLGWSPRQSLSWLSGWLILIVLIVFVAAIYHHVRYLVFDSKVLRDPANATIPPQSSG